MGASNGGIAVKTDTSIIDLQKVAKDLFGSSFEKTDSHCDPRKSDCVYISKTKDFLIIINTDFADKFFASQSTNNIQQYLDYFSKPGFVFAFEEYDSGGTYSYSLIYDGVVKRQFRSISYETTIDFGELEPIELKWKNAETYTEDLGDDEFIIMYKDPTRDFQCAAMDLPQVMLHELMIEKLGFLTWNMNDFLIEYGRFKGTPNSQKALPTTSIPASTEPASKKPWWKLW